MWSGAVALLAWLCVARASPAADHSLRSHIHSMHTTKELTGVLNAIEEKLRILDAVSAAQAQTARRLDVIQDKLDRVESTLSLRLERAQLAAERLEHRLHMLQTSVQVTIDESSKRLERSQAHIVAVAQNLTNHLDTHRHLLEKVSGAYVETWRRGLVLESLMRDGLSLVNATRRELADGLRSLARRQRDSRHTSAELEAAFTKRLNDNTYRIDLKMQEVLDAQKRFVDLCQRVQLDDPTHVTDVLDKLMNSLINKTASTFQELQSIQVALRYHDNRIMKLLSTSRVGQSSDGSCRRLEATLRNITQRTVKETELNQLTEKFIALTDRADAALQRLEARLADNEPAPSSDITTDADRLLSKLNGIRTEEESYDDEEDWEEDDQSAGYFDDSSGGDIMEEDKNILTRGDKWDEGKKIKETTTTVRTSHRRHLHKHPYDRGPIKRNET